MMPFITGIDFSNGNLNRISIRDAWVEDCCFDGTSINFSDFCFAHFQRCTFRGASIRVSKFGSARFKDCCFDRADLSYCSAEETSFSGSSFCDTSLCHVSFVRADLSNTRLDGTHVYGVSVWELNTEGSCQSDLLVTRRGDPQIKVDNVEVAQFIHLLIYNPKVRGIIDTITSRVVLILGRFTPERKKVLDELKADLRYSGFVPVLFDFEGPQSRDLTETISTLAHLACIVIADLTEPKSIPHELASIIPHLPSVPVQPIIAEGHNPYGMFEHFDRYPWVREVISYNDSERQELAEKIIRRCLR
ncbi:pentapeptide repeat-containing protein [Rhodocaloribacter sp.]